MISQHGMEVRATFQCPQDCDAERNVGVYAYRGFCQAVNACFHEMQNIIIRSLLAVQKVMINEKNCFELYGDASWNTHDVTHAHSLIHSLVQVTT